MLTDFQEVKKFPAFYGTQKFITTITSARQLSLSWATSINSYTNIPTSLTPILKLFYHLGLGLPNVLHKKVHK
jgi:hypothetical protein